MNTMKGMPGFINTRMGASSGNLRGGKSIAPKNSGREIGHKGGSGAPKMGKASMAPGFATKNYKAASSGTGKIQGNGAGGQGAGSKYSIPGGGKNKGGSPHAGQPTGKMEKFKGKAKFVSERGGNKRSSMMY